MPTNDLTRKYVNSFKMGLSGSTGPFVGNLLRRAAPSYGVTPDVIPTTWTRPVIRLGGYNEEPFMKAQSTAACGFRPFDQLVRKGRWRRRSDLSGFAVRFPSLDDPR